MLLLTVLLSPDFSQLSLSLSYFFLFSAFWDSVSSYSLHEVHIDIKNRTVSEVLVQKWIQRGTARRRLTVEWTELTPHWYQYLTADAAICWETEARVWVVTGADVPRSPGEGTSSRTFVSHVHSFHPLFLSLFFFSWDVVWLCFWDWLWAWCSSGLPASFSLLSSWNRRYILLPLLQLLLS